ncbi:MAG: hypothetical protein ACFFB2_11500 [Promethearchaeota archaeon]
MTSQDESGKVANERKSKKELQWQQYAREVLDFILGFRNAIIIIFAWILISQISGYSVLNILGSIVSLLFYPINLLLFNTGFNEINVPEVFFLLVPLMILIIVGFLIIISTED